MRTLATGTSEKKHYSGFVALIGRPNAGKSTLMNQMIGEKVAIMSARPQTTRNKIMGIYSSPEAQIIFLDTPGIHKAHHKLGEYMNRAATSTLTDVDVVLLVVDATEKLGEEDELILQQLRDEVNPQLTKVILVVNKIDRLQDKSVLLRFIKDYAKAYTFKAVVPVAAIDGTAVPELVQEIVAQLPEGPCYYPEDQITDQQERVIAGEMIREKVLLMTRDEIPHAVAVEVNDFKVRENDMVFIRATIFVERESQKGIVIGAKGAMLKQIGQLARQDIERLLGNKVFLELWVKVRADWRNKESSIKEFGYGDRR